VNTQICTENRGAASILRLLMISMAVTLPVGASTQEQPTKKTVDKSAPPAGKSDTTEIVERIQAYYASAADYQASFVQTTAHKMFAGRLQRAYGVVKFKKGGLMRWEYTRPEKKYFIYDGKKLWIYEPEVPQIFSGNADAERLRRALAFISGDGKILDEYTAEKLDAAKHGLPEGVVLGLRPKDVQSPYKSIELYLDKTTFRVKRSVVVDQQGNRNRLDFTNPKLGNSLPDSEFSFTPPAGVPVIDPTKPQ
jgi:outer membrane lipoprotein carrier protein